MGNGFIEQQTEFEEQRRILKQDREEFETKRTEVENAKAYYLKGKQRNEELSAQLENEQLLLETAWSGLLQEMSQLRRAKAEHAKLAPASSPNAAEWIMVDDDMKLGSNDFSLGTPM